jgi:hypothetical protein
MSDATLVSRADALVEQIERFERHRNAEQDLFSIQLALTDFAELRDQLRELRARADRLIRRGTRVNLPDGEAIGILLRKLATAVDHDPTEVRERATVVTALRQHIRAIESEVDHATVGYVEGARGGIDEGLLGALKQGGFPDAATTLRSALTVLRQSMVTTPTTDEEFDAIDEAAAQVRDVMTSLEAPEHAALLTLLRAVVTPGEVVTLEDVTPEHLAELQRSGAARNFTVGLRPGG